MSAWIQYYSSKNWHFLNLLTCPRSLFPDVIYWWSLLRKCAAAKAKVKSFFPTILGACNAHWDARTRMYSTNLVFWYWLCAMFYVIWGNALRKWFKSCSYTHSAHRLIHTFGGSLKKLYVLFKIEHFWVFSITIWTMNMFEVSILLIHILNSLEYFDYCRFLFPWTLTNSFLRPRKHNISYIPLLIFRLWVLFFLYFSWNHRAVKLNYCS